MKERLKNKQWLSPVAAFAAVWAIYLFYFALGGFYPFGERSIAWCDMEQQYVPLMMEVRSIILDGGSVLLGRGGGGMNFWGVFLFFVSSPFVLLSLLVKESDIIHFINILTVLKLSLCGASAAFYFRRLFPKLPQVFGVLMSVMYSLSGFAMMYYQNSMWLEMMMLFPLLLLSMFRLIEKGKWGAYTLCLSAALYLNFYISFMYVIFIVIAGGLLLIYCCNGRNRPDRALKLITADACAAMITAVVWLPAFRQFMNSGRGSSTMKLFFEGEFFENASDKAALFACTSIVFAAIVLIALKRKRLGRGKGAFFAVLTVLIALGAFIEPSNKLWHTGNYQAFPFRYAFMALLSAMSVCALILSDRSSYSVKSEKQLKRSRIVILAVLLLFAASAVPVFFYSSKLDSYVSSLWVKGSDAVILVSFGLVGSAVYFLCIRGYCSGTVRRRFVFAVMACVMLIESLLSFNVYFGNVTDVTERFAQTETLNDKINDDDFYRVKSTKRYFYTNMLEGLGFSSIGHYTSLTDGDFMFASKRMGYSSYWMDNSANGGTIITDAFLMNRYFLGVSSDMNSYCVLENDDELINIYRNTLVSEGAVISEKSPEELSEFDNVQRMDAAAYIGEKLYNIEDAVEKRLPYEYENVTVSEDENGIHFDIGDTEKAASVGYTMFIEGKKELYFDLFGNYSNSLSEPYFQSVSVSVNGKSVEKLYPNKRASGILDLGTYENKYVSVKVTIHKDFCAKTFGLYTLDCLETEKGIKSAETAEISLEGNKIRISSETDGGKYVYIPFAYNDGFSAKLNGEKADIHKVLGSFMAVKLDEGGNELVLTFYPVGFRAGAIISLLGAIAFTLIIHRYKELEKCRKAGRCVCKLLITLSVSAAFVIYLLAPLAWLILRLSI